MRKINPATNNVSKKRIRFPEIDLVKAFAAFLVIFIHVMARYTNTSSFHYYAWDLSHFSVGLFVFASGFLMYKESSSTDKRSNVPMIKWLLKKLQRIVLPYIIFSIFFLASQIITDGLQTTLNSLSPIFLLNTLTLNGGIGNNWVPRIFMWLSLIYYLAELIKPKFKYIFHLLTGLALILSIYYLFSGISWLGIDQNVAGWFLILMVGALHRKYFDKIQKWVYPFLGILLLIFFSSGAMLYFAGKSLSIITNKYPPNIYFVAYNVLLIVPIYMAFKKISIKTKRTSFFRETVMFYSNAAYEIFFYHLILLELINDTRWGALIEYIFIVTITSIFVYIIYKSKKLAPLLSLFILLVIALITGINFLYVNQLNNIQLKYKPNERACLSGTYLFPNAYETESKNFTLSFSENSIMIGKIKVLSKLLCFTPQAQPINKEHSEAYLKSRFFDLDAMKIIIEQESCDNILKYIDKSLNPDYPINTSCTSSDIIGTSVNGTHIRNFKIGKGEKTLVFFGAIHGVESNTAQLLRNWVTELEINYNSIPKDVTVIVIPELNPDGVKLHTRFNANNVDLNRNFETAHWQQKTYFHGKTFPLGGGIKPFSEPETRAIIDLISENDPDLVISYHSAAAYTIPSSLTVDLGRIYSKESGYKFIAPTKTNAFTYTITGAYGTWAVEHNVPSIIIELATPDKTEEKRNFPAMWEMLYSISNLK